VTRATAAVAATTQRSLRTTSTVTTTVGDTIPALATAVAVVRQTPPPAPTTTTTTTTTTAPPPPPIDALWGVASWYPEAPPGYCASPYLSFGTVVTITDVATGESIRCTVDDRQAENPGRVIDLSYDGFADLADPSTGLVEVRLTW
jgi:rare lipoprotein A (peptidoglycan hydrolase)